MEQPENSIVALMAVFVLLCCLFASCLCIDLPGALQVVQFLIRWGVIPETCCPAAMVCVKTDDFLMPESDHERERQQMSDFMFRLCVAATMVITIGGMVAEELGSKSLPEILRTEKLKAKELVVAACKAHPAQGFLRFGILAGYLASLAGLFFFMPYSPWCYLFFTLAWSALTIFDAPHMISRTHAVFYEASLLLNGALLALCLLSPVSGLFL